MDTLRPMTNRIIEVVKYDSNWPKLFNKEQAMLSTIFQELAIAIEHIGSTSVPGLVAKPIIDILVEVSDLNKVDALNKELAEKGYRAKGENGICGRRYFHKGDPLRTHHVHVFESNNANLTQHRAFKTYLLNNHKVASEYGEIKKQAAKQCQNDNYRYMTLKDDFIRTHLKIALRNIESNSLTMVSSTWAEATSVDFE